MNLTDLETFVRVAEHGSFTSAAEELSVPKSTVSRRVARLEDDLGIELLQRSARSMSLTDHGRRLHERCAPALREIAEAEASVLDVASQPRGQLRLTAPPDLGGTRFFAGLLTSFRQQYPQITLRVELLPRLVDLIEEGFDVALRAHTQALPESTTMMVRRLGSFQAGLYAAPSYLEQQGRPQAPDELERHACVTHTAPGLAQTWTLQPLGEGRTVAVDVNPVLVANDFGLLLSALVDGVGVGLAPTFLASPHVASGELERVLPEICAASSSLSLSWPRARYLAPRVRAFVDHVVGHAGLMQVLSSG